MSTTYHLPLRALRLSPLLQQPLLARPFPQSSRLIPTTTTKPTTLTRTFRTSTSPLLHPDTAAAAVAATPPIRKPAGAFRSGIVGFLLGSTLAGVATWFYIMEEYRVSNELLTEDIYALQAAVQRIHTLVLALEERLALAEMKGAGGKK